MQEAATLQSIKRLDQTVVNRIAAGEIIHRPANALKELIENSIDAGSTNIQILIKDGGLKLLQIQDNGCGIRREDMEIVCERFTTSKLKSFDDLGSISTYGFRGEALASISHVAHVTITTKTADSKCAFRASYSDGKLVPQKPGMSNEPKPTAGNKGTQITAEDLFYNVPSRRKALKSPSDEYSRILDVVTRYAIHNSGISFSCKKQGANMADVNTATNNSIIDNIRLLYGSAVASELISVEQEFDDLEFKMKAYISNANYHVKKWTMLLFINHRAVESSMLKKMIENVYITLLPKGSHPFVYLSLEINPQNVDVNVHPTKREVHFLNEEKLIEAVADTIQEKLAGANDSRTFYTQTLLPGASEVEEMSAPKSAGKVSENKFVRTDSKLRTLDNFLHPPSIISRPTPITAEKPTESAAVSSSDIEMEDVREEAAEVMPEAQSIRSATGSTNVSTDRQRVEVRLTSLLELRKEVKKNEHKGLSDVFADHTFVGVVDDTLALIQRQTKLYLVNYSVISEELFYQLVLREFSNFGYINMSSSIPIKDFIMVALDEEEAQNGWPDNMKPKDEIAQSITNLLIERAEMLHEYFSIRVSENGELLSIPMLIKNYVPTLDKLPLFLLRLGTEVDWDGEKECFETLAKEIALFYSAEPPLRESAEGNQIDDQDDQRMSESNITDPSYEKDHKAYLWQVEHLIFPALKFQFAAPKSLAASSGPGSGHVVQLANLPDLYKIFERC
ncbi:DNA mismatch repair protein Mlh1 [Umbelopsis sp. PMI_123]|nr:DNA mismatch repair protein Mlh1 [Umbelopsis sp. PMI_123]